MKLWSSIKFPTGAAIVALALGLTTACSQQETFTIGVVFPETGFASYLLPTRHGLDMGLEEVNSIGGIAGRPVELIYMDSGSNPDTGRDAYTALVAGHEPDMMISVLSSVSTGIGSLADEYQIPTIGTIASDPRVAELTPYLYKYYFTADGEAQSISSFIQRESLEEVTVLYQDEAYGQSVYMAIAEWGAGAGVTVQGSPFAVNGDGLEAAVQVAASTPGVAIVGFEQNCIDALLALHAIAYGGVIMGTSTLSTEVFAALPEADGMYVSAPAVYNVNYFRSRDLSERYASAYGGSLHHNAAVGYDLMIFLSGILSGMETVSSAEIVARLSEGFVYPGVFGSIELEDGRRSFQIPLIAAQFDGGNLTFFE